MVLFPLGERNGDLSLTADRLIRDPHGAVESERGSLVKRKPHADPLRTAVFAGKVNGSQHLQVLPGFNVAAIKLGECSVAQAGSADSHL